VIQPLVTASRGGRIGCEGPVVSASTGAAVATAAGSGPCAACCVAWEQERESAAMPRARMAREVLTSLPLSGKRQVERIQYKGPEMRAGIVAGYAEQKGKLIAGLIRGDDRVPVASGARVLGVELVLVVGAHRLHRGLHLGRRGAFGGARLGKLRS